MTDRLNVMTFNIRHGRALDGRNRWFRRRDMVFEIIRRYDPDVVGLQEVDPFQLDELLDTFPTYGVIAHRRYGGIVGAYAPVLFDKDRFGCLRSGDFWLSPEPDGERQRSWDAAVVRICTWGILLDRASGRHLAVFNSHFDQRGVEARLHSARLVARRLRGLGDLPRVFTVDLNANEDSEPLAILRSAGMRDSFRIARPDEKPAFTYHRFRGTRSRGVLGKIDFVLCDAHWDVRAASIVRDDFDGRWPSDHYPLIAELALRDNTGETQSRR